ncbi:Exportin-4 [Geranomyces michiganensis]|nr:Exportin-4 [Geranomyces michiganensis]
MDLPAVHAQFEQACAIFSQPATRKEGERIITRFRSTANILPACKYIIEHTQKDDVRFHAVMALKEAVVREYALHPRADIHAYRDWLLEFVSKGVDQMQGFIASTICHAVAVIFKRGCLDESPQEKEGFFRGITAMVNGSTNERQVALSVFSALVDEFSSDRASAVGLPYNFHVKSRKTFEEGELPPVFLIVVQILQHLMSTATSMCSEKDVHMLTICMEVLSKCLSWEFVSADDNPLLGSLAPNTPYRTRTRQLGSFPTSWRDLLIRADFIDMFFQLYHMIPDKTWRLAEKVRMCLVQLAGVHGAVFQSTDQEGRTVEDDNVQRSYIGRLLQNYLTTVERFMAADPFNSGNEFTDELVCVTSMATKVIQTYRLRIIAAVPEFLPFLNELGKLNIVCYTIKGDDEEFWETGAHEEGDELLDLWAQLIEQTEEYAEELAALQTTGHHQPEFDLPQLNQFLTVVSYHIFETYVNMRLEAAKHSIDDEDLGEEMTDDYMYEEQLVAVGIIARMDPEKCLGKLQQLINDRLAHVQAIFNGSNRQTNAMPYLSEHLHWLALFAGHILAHPSRGEMPEVPRAIMALSARSPENSDLAVSLATTLMNVLEVVSVEPDSPKLEMCSPLLTETLLWFVERWSESYLFVPGLSPGLDRAFGPQFGGPHVLDFVLRMIQKAFVTWHGEEDLLMQIVNILNTYSKREGIRNALLMSDKFETLIGYFLGNLDRLPAGVYSPLIESITTIASKCTDIAVKTHFFTRLTEALERRLLAVLQDPLFAQKFQGPEMIQHVIGTMELYSGFVLAADETNTRHIYAAVSKYFDSLVQLLDLYRNHTEVEKYVLQIFANLIRCQSFEELTEADCDKLYAAVMALLKTYAKNSAGRTRLLRASDDEEAVEDLSCIFDLLAQLMASQYEGMTWEETLAKRKSRSGAASGPPGSPDVAEVVFYGVGVVAPLVTDQMLQFPELCKDYITLVGNMVRYFPDRLSVLPPTLLAGLIQALEFGMHNVMVEVARSAFEAMTTLALFAWDEGAHPVGVSQDFLCPHLDKLLTKTLSMFLFMEFDSGLLDSGGEALFALTLARPQTYTAMVHHLVQQQPAPVLAQRLEAVLLGVHGSIAQTLGTPGNSDRLRAARSEGLVTGAWLGPYRKRLEAALMEVRGFLRVK